MQVSISDGMGRGVMSAQMHGPKAAPGDINTLIDWSCTQYDKSYTVPGNGYGLSEAVVRIDSDGNTTQSFTNGFGHQVGSMDQLGNISKQRNGPKGEPRYRYDAEGNLTKYVYDALGRQRYTDDPLLRRQSTTYDTAGRVKTRIDAKGNSTQTIYDDLGRVKEIQDRAGKSTHRTYDAAGRLATIKDAQNKTTTYGYNALGRRTSTTLADTSARSMTYDAAGRVTRVDLPSGNYKTNSYRENATDVSGLLREVKYYDAPIRSRAPIQLATMPFFAVMVRPVAMVSPQRWTTPTVATLPLNPRLTVARLTRLTTGMMIAVAETKSPIHQAAR
jgi:YD repeat-containing protein